MPLIDALGDLPAGIGQRDGSFRGDLDAAVLPELFHGDADAGFFEIQFRRDIYGADHRLALAQDQDCL